MGTTRGAAQGVTRKATAETQSAPLQRRNESRDSGDRNARTGAPAAIILVDADLEVLCLNADAVRVLSFPGGPAAAREGWHAIRSQILSVALPGVSGPSAAFRNFVSGGRRYRCRVFPLEVPRSRHGAPSAVVVIERDLPAWFPTAESLARFHLTAREEQAVRFALSGLTNRQIAVEMGISPNTVKALLRLAMTKIGVSSRMGILQKLSLAHDAGGDSDVELADPAIESVPARRASERVARRNTARTAAHSGASDAEYWLTERRRASSLVPGGHP